MDFFPKKVSKFDLTEPYKKVAPNENCEAGWFYMESTNLCYYIDHYHTAGWDAAQANCVGLAANLASINSPDAQSEIRIHLNDPDAIGILEFLPFLLFLTAEEIISILIAISKCLFHMLANQEALNQGRHENDIDFVNVLSKSDNDNKFWKSDDTDETRIK